MASLNVVFDVIVKLFNIKTLKKKKHEGIKWCGEFSFSLKMVRA